MSLLPLWAKWLAVHCTDYLDEMRRIESRRPRRNWAILVADDELACMYQRMRFRLERARYACGLRGLLGEGSVGVVDGKLTVIWKDAGAIDELNRASLDQERQRAVQAKRAMQDKHHPLEAFETFLNAVNPERYV